jgi:hypothetical protein
MADRHFSAPGRSSEMMASIFPRDVVSIAFLSSRTKLPYSALWLIKMVPGFMAATPC